MAKRIINYSCNIQAESGECNKSIMDHVHSHHNELSIKNGTMNYEQLTAAIAYHATNLTKDNTSTIITENRILTIRNLLDVLEGYNNQLIEIEDTK